MSKTISQMTDNLLYPDLSYKIIGLAMEVHNKLGGGFLEKVYENSLMVLFKREGISAIQQCSIDVYFEGVVVGKYTADILVEDQIILELKATDKITEAHRAQGLNYLKATGKRLIIIINFSKRRLETERLVY